MIHHLKTLRLAGLVQLALGEDKQAASQVSFHTTANTKALNPLMIAP